jgi:hypothetical protein
MRCSTLMSSSRPRCQQRWLASVLAMLVAVMLATFLGTDRQAEAQHYSDAAATRLFLDRLEERQMPDVMLWVLDRIAADPEAAADLKGEVRFRRATALVAASRSEADSGKRAQAYDEAQKEIDAYLATKPRGLQAVDAYTQKGNLLIERGRGKLEQAKRPKADVKAVRAEAADFFSAAIKALEGTVTSDPKAKPGADIAEATNAEDAAIQEFRRVREEIAAIKGEKPGDAKGGGEAQGAEGQGAKQQQRRPARLSAADQRKLEELDALDKELQAKIIQTRLMVAAAYFEKASAFEPKSKEWTETLAKSTEKFKALADKYPTKGGGLFARYYEGRNLALAGNYEKAAATLAPLSVLEDRAPLAMMLRAKALGTIAESLVPLKKFTQFDDSARKFALTPADRLPGRKLDDDWITLKYRAAVLLDAWADSLDAKERSTRIPLQREALKLSREVALANAGFAKEARDLASKLGKDVPDDAGAKDFASVIAEGRAAVASMQAKKADAASAAADKKAALDADVVKEREIALKLFEEAIALAVSSSDGSAAGGAAAGGAADEANLNYARYMTTFFNYEKKNFSQAAEMGRLLAEQYPNAMGSRQAAMIGMASLQQLARAQDQAAAAKAKADLTELARIVARIWPDENEGSEAFNILGGAAIESGDPKAIIALAEEIPAGSAKRAQYLQRAGAALSRAAAEQGRKEKDDPSRPPAETLTAWKQKARGYLDEGLAGPVPSGPALRAMAAAALARCQLAMDDGDMKLTLDLLQHPAYGPWTLVTAADADASLRDPAFAEPVLTVALRAFVQGEALDKAQQAMDQLEALAAAGGATDSSERLTAMYLQMGRQLQDQLAELSKGDNAADGQKAAAIVAGFEKFLDGIEKRDKKVSTQIWVASTYLDLGSGESLGNAVPKPQAEGYLDRAAKVFEALLGKKGDAEIAKFEPAIRQRMADIYLQRGKLDDALAQFDWILADPGRQNSLTTQIKAAELLQAAGKKLAASDPKQAEERLREAIAGRTKGKSVIWGWGGLSNKLSRPAFAGSDEKSLKARGQFFDARYNVAACLFARSRLPGADAKDLAQKAETAISMTYKLNRDLGGEAMKTRYESLLKDVQKALGKEPRGFAALEEQTAAVQ